MALPVDSINVADTTNFSSDITTKELSTQEKTQSLNNFNSLEDSTKHEITTFVERPVRIGRYQMLTTQEAGDYIVNNVSFPSTLLKNQMYFEKLKGMYAIRANVKIRVQVNATRFQAGRLLMYYLPTPNYSSYRKLAGDLYNTTQLPKVELDIATESEVTFEIPYVAPWTHCIIPPSTTDDKYELFDFASLAIQVYSPLLDPSSSPVNITVWASFTDVDFVLPAIAQSREVKIKGRRNKIKLSPEEEETGESEYVGKFSKPLSTISEVSSKLAGIPVLSSVAGPVSWASAIGADIASAFGYCKPFEHTHSVVKQSVMHHNLNIDDKITGHVGALEVQNKVEHLPNFAGNLQDEMAFDYLLTKSSLLKTVTWSTNSDENTALVWLFCNPDNSYYTELEKKISNISYPNSTIVRGPVYGHLSRQFRYFRGGFKYKLKFVKTEFHSGRLEIMFNPHIYRETSPDNWDSQWLHRDIIDIRGLTEYEFTVPYVSPLAYTSVDNSFGTIVIKIVNKLVAPSTVSQTVPIIIESAALPGFELSIPRNIWMYNADDDVPFESVDPTIVAQAKGFELDVDFFEAVLGTSNIKFQGAVTNSDIVDSSDKKETAQLGMANLNSNSNISSQTIGERILSVRQLIKRPTQVGYADFATVFANGTNVAIDDNLTAAQWNYLPFGMRRYSLLRYYGSWFAYRRGGTILRINPIDGGVFSMIYATIPGMHGTGLKWLTVQNDKSSSYRASNSGLISMERVDLSGSLDFRLPYYRPMPFDVTNYKTIDDKIPSAFNRFVFGGRVNGNSASTQRVDVYQSAADDFSFGFFTGTGYSCFANGDEMYDTSGPETQHNSGYVGTTDVKIVGIDTPDVLNTAATAPIAVSQNGPWNVNSSVTNGNLNVNANIVAVDGVGVDKDLGVPIQIKTASTTLATNSNITNTNLSVTNTPTGTQSVNIKQVGGFEMNSVRLPINIEALSGADLSANSGIPIGNPVNGQSLRVNLRQINAQDVPGNDGVLPVNITNSEIAVSNTPKGTQNVNVTNNNLAVTNTPTGTQNVNVTNSDLGVNVARLGGQQVFGNQGLPVKNGDISGPLSVNVARVNDVALNNTTPAVPIDIARMGNNVVGANSGLAVHSGEASAPLRVDLSRINNKALTNQGSFLDTNIASVGGGVVFGNQGIPVMNSQTTGPLIIKLDVTKNIDNNPLNSKNDFGSSTNVIPVCIVGPNEQTDLPNTPIRPATVRPFEPRTDPPIGNIAKSWLATYN